ELQSGIFLDRQEDTAWPAVRGHDDRLSCGFNLDLAGSPLELLRRNREHGDTSRLRIICNLCTAFAQLAPVFHFVPSCAPGPREPGMTDTDRRRHAGRCWPTRISPRRSAWRRTAGTTDHISPAGPWLCYCGHLENSVTTCS